jgi:hypothetical protein
VTGEQLGGALQQQLAALVALQASVGAFGHMDECSALLTIGRQACTVLVDRWLTKEW